MTTANINIRQYLLKRGNTAVTSAYTGPLGEIVLDTDLDTIRIQDGVTAGGTSILATQAQINSLNSNVSSTNSNLASAISSTNSNLASAITTINNNISTITGFDSNVVANLSALLSDASIQQTTINNIEANVLSLQNNPVYANANVASFLPVYGGNIALTNITSPELGPYSIIDGNSAGGGLPAVYYINSPLPLDQLIHVGDRVYDSNNLSNYATVLAPGVVATGNGNFNVYYDNFGSGPSALLFGTASTAWTFSTGGDITLPGNIQAGDGSAIQFAKNYEYDSGSYHIQGDTISLVANVAFPAISWNFVTSPIVVGAGTEVYAQNSLTAPYSDFANVGLLQFGGPSGVGTIWWEGGAYSGNTQPYLNSLNLDSTANVVVSTNNEGYNWTFSNVGELTLPNGGHLGPVGKGWTGLDGGAGNPVSLLSYYNSGMYSGCFTITPGSSAQITTYGDGTGQTGQWTFANNGVLTTTGDVVVGGNVSLNGGVIHGGTPTVTDINDTITIISLGTTTVLIFENNVFEYPTRGLANVTGISTTTQANGSWYYEAINYNAVALYTDNTYATEVNSSAWTPYTSGDGLIAIAQDVPGESVVVDANGYLTTFNYVGALQLPTSADLEGQQKYSVVQTPFNADLQLQVGNDSVYTFTANGNVTLPGGIKFSDNTVQTTAAVNPDSDWTNPNNNTWHIRTYNGGYSFTYAQGASPTVWWDAANSPLGGLNQFRGAVIEYHAYISGNTNGTVVGSIIVAQDGTTNIEATHTENIDLFNNASTINFWSRPSYTQLGYSNSGLTVSGQQDNVMIMWTARVFYGSENAC